MSRLTARSADNLTIAQMVAQRASFLITLVVSLGLLITGRIDSGFNPQIQQWVVDVAAPVARTVAKPVDWVRGLGAMISDFTMSAEEAARLRQENDQLRLQLSTSAQLEAENTRLRDQLGLPPVTDYGKITARSVTHPGSPFLWTVMLDAGANRNVAPYQPVINHAGVIGRVLSVGNQSSRALLIADLNSRVPVVIAETGDRAILEGDNSRQPVLAFLEAAHTVLPGHHVVTSGDGGVFPPLLPIGVVMETAPGLLQVELHADLSRLDYVQILDFDPLAPPEDDPVVNEAPLEAEVPEDAVPEQPATESPAEQPEQAAGAEG